MGQCRFTVWPQNCRRVTQRGLASAPWTVGEFDLPKESATHILEATNYRKSDSLADVHESQDDIPHISQPWRPVRLHHNFVLASDSSHPQPDIYHA